jgi:hypothetical protein
MPVGDKTQGGQHPGNTAGKPVTEVRHGEHRAELEGGRPSTTIDVGRLEMREFKTGE